MIRFKKCISSILDLRLLPTTFDIIVATVIYLQTKLGRFFHPDLAGGKS